MTFWMKRYALLCVWPRNGMSWFIWEPSCGTWRVGPFTLISRQRGK